MGTRFYKFLFGFLSLVLLIAAATGLSSGMAFAEEEESLKNYGILGPEELAELFYADIERVFVYIQYQGLTEEEAKTYGPVLSKDNATQVILEELHNIFVSMRCKDKSGNCQIPRITPVPQAEAYNFLLWKDISVATSEELKDEGTLVLLYDLKLFRNIELFDPPLDVPVMVMTRYSYRRGKNITPGLIPNMRLVPINQSEDFLEKNLRGLARQI